MSQITVRELMRRLADAEPDDLVHVRLTRLDRVDDPTWEAVEDVRLYEGDADGPGDVVLTLD